MGRRPSVPFQQIFAFALRDTRVPQAHSCSNPVALLPRSVGVSFVSRAAIGLIVGADGFRASALVPHFASSIQRFGPINPHPPIKIGRDSRRARGGQPESPLAIGPPDGDCRNHHELHHGQAHSAVYLRPYAQALGLLHPRNRRAGDRGSRRCRQARARKGRGSRLGLGDAEKGARPTARPRRGGCQSKLLALSIGAPIIGRACRAALPIARPPVL